MKDIKRDFSDTVLAIWKSKNIMKTNELIAEKYILVVVLLVIDVLLFLGTTFIINLFFSLLNVRSYEALNHILSVRQFIPHVTRFPKAYMVIVVGMVILDIYWVYKIQVNYAMDTYNKGQKGTNRWTTIEEIKEQYKEIPEKDEMYSGAPGTIISRYEDKIYEYAGDWKNRENNNSEL